MKLIKSSIRLEIVSLQNLKHSRDKKKKNYADSLTYKKPDYAADGVIEKPQDQPDLKFFFKCQELYSVPLPVLDKITNKTLFLKDYTL